MNNNKRGLGRGLEALFSVFDQENEEESVKELVEEEKEGATKPKTEKVKIPDDIDYTRINHISTETREKLNKIRPKTLGQASRIGGVKPADIAILSVMIEGKRYKRDLITD